MAQINIGGIIKININDPAKNEVVDSITFDYNLEEDDNKESDLGWFQLVDMEEVDGVWCEVVLTVAIGEVKALHYLKTIK